MRFSLSSSHALEMKCDMQISYEMVSNAHVHQLTVSLLTKPKPAQDLKEKNTISAFAPDFSSLFATINKIL